jgi:surface antigen
MSKHHSAEFGPADCRAAARLSNGVGFRAASNAAVRALSLVVALSSGACSLSFPMSPLTSEDAPTGSIKSPAAATALPGLDAQDWQSARAALNQALDQKGRSTGVTWSNPKSGARGSFTAVAAAYQNDDRRCRAFKADLLTPSDPPRILSGSACRAPGGEWVPSGVKDPKGS